MSLPMIALLTADEAAEVIDRLERLGLYRLADAVLSEEPEVAAVIGRPLLALNEDELVDPLAAVRYLEALPED